MNHQPGKNNVTVIGGGITGLSAAYYLEQLASERNIPIAITLLERENRLGGKIQTESREGYVIEHGPESLFMQKTAVRDLIHSLGLEEELISPRKRQFQLLWKGKLHEVSPQLFRPYPENLAAVWKAPFLSFSGKLRVIAAPRMKEMPTGNSIADHLRARWGEEFSKRALEPLYAGIHAGNAEQLNIQSLYPQLVGEKADPRLTLAGLRALMKQMTSFDSSPSPFQSLRSGLEILVETTRKKLNFTEIRKGTSVTAVREAGLEVFTDCDASSPIRSDACLVALPSFAAADILQNLDPALPAVLREIPFASSAIVTLAYNARDVLSPLDATGFVSTAKNQALMTASTWTSVKWESRSPGDKVLLRGYLGNSASGTDLNEIPDKSLIDEANRMLRKLLRISGKPLFSEVHRWPQSLPQYEIEHPDRLRRIDQLMTKTPRIHLAGASYRGLGIPDCIRQGREAAQRIIEQLARSE